MRSTNACLASLDTITGDPMHCCGQESCFSVQIIAPSLTNQMVDSGLWALSTIHLLGLWLCRSVLLSLDLWSSWTDSLLGELRVCFDGSHFGVLSADSTSPCQIPFFLCALCALCGESSVDFWFSWTSFPLCELCDSVVNSLWLRPHRVDKNLCYSLIAVDFEFARISSALTSRPNVSDR
jgi:hypothetical protein